MVLCAPCLITFVCHHCFPITKQEPFVKPYHTYPSTSSWKRMKKVCIDAADKQLSGKEFQEKVNSHLGVMSHYDCFDMCRVSFGYESGLTEKGRFDKDILRFYPS